MLYFVAFIGIDRDPPKSIRQGMYVLSTQKLAKCMKFAQNYGKYLYKNAKKQVIFSICSIVDKMRICYNFMGSKKRCIKNTYIRRSRI